MTLNQTAIRTINGQPINVHEEGLHNVKVALMIHGWSSSWYAVAPLLPLLSQRYRCLAVDLPGYGASPRMNSRVTIDKYAEMMISLI